MNPDVDHVNKSGKIEKTQAELQKHTENATMVVNVDMNRVASLPPDQCHLASGWLSGTGLYYTLDGGFKKVCATPSGKAWMLQFNLVNVFIAAAPPEQKDTVLSQVFAEGTTITITIQLKLGGANISSSYNDGQLKDAMINAIPQLATGEDMDSVAKSRKIEKTQAELQKHTGNATMVVNVDMNRVASLPPDQCHLASGWLSGTGLYYTLDGGFKKVCATPSGKAWMLQFNLVNVFIAAAPPEQKDTVLSQVFAEGTIITITIQLKLGGANISSSYNDGQLKEALTSIIS